MANVLDQVNIGDVVVGCLSYSATFYSFYEVIGKTATTVKLQELNKSYVPGGTQAATQTKPVLKSYNGKPIVRRPGKRDYVMSDGDWSSLIHLDRKYDPNTKYVECYLD